MANFYDNFSGAAGVLTGTVSPSGHTWGPAGCTVASLTGDGYAYANGSQNWGSGYVQFTDWVPSGADYEVEVTLASDEITIADRVGPAIRLSGTAGNTIGYFAAVLPQGSSFVIDFYELNGNSNSFLFSTSYSGSLKANDRIKLRATGSLPVVLTVFQNGTQVATYSHGSGTVASAGSAGFVAGLDDSTVSRKISHIWAGPIGTDSITATPTQQVIHTPGGTTITLAGTTDSLPLGSTTFNLTTSLGSVTPSVTLTNPGTLSGTAALSIPSGQSVPQYPYVTISNSAGVVPVKLEIDIVAPAAQIVPGSLRVKPGGNLIEGRLETTGGSPVPVSIAAFNLAGGTVTVNGGMPIPLDGVNVVYPTGNNNNNNWFWFNIGTGFAATILDEIDAGCVLHGTWTSTSQASARFQLFTTVTGGNGAAKYSSVLTDTAVYTITGLTPGLAYKIQRVWPDIYTSLDGSTVGIYSVANGSVGTTAARWSATDGTTTWTATRDLTQGATGDFDSDLQYRWEDLVTVTPAGSTLTITLSNQGSGGFLIADAVRVVTVETSRCSPGDIVVLSLPDSAITTTSPGGTLGPVNVTIPVSTPGQEWPDPGTPIGLKFGVNTSGYAINGPGRITADQVKYGTDWSGDYPGWTTDGTTGQLTGAPTVAGASATLSVLLDGDKGKPDQGTGTGFDGFGVPTARTTQSVAAGRSPTWVIPFTSMGTVTLQFMSFATTGVSSPPQTFGPGDHVFTPTLTYTELAPSFNVPLALRCTTTTTSGNDYITNVRIYPPGVDMTRINAGGIADQDTYDRLKQLNGGFVRTLVTSSVNTSNVLESYEQYPTRFRYDADAFSESFPFATLEPVNNSTNAEAYAIAQNGAGSVWSFNSTLVFVTFSADHPFGPAGTIRFMSITAAGTPLPLTNGGTGNFTNGDTSWGLILDSRTILFECRSTNGDGTRTWDTLVGTYTAVGGDNVFLASGQGAPASVMLDTINECGMVPWINVGLSTSPDYSYQLGRYAALNHPGKPFVVECGNEPWDGFGPNSVHHLWIDTAAQNYFWTSTSGAQGFPLGLIAAEPTIYAWRADQMRNQVVAGYTGIPEVRITGGGGTGARAVATVVGGVVTAINVTNGGGGGAGGQGGANNNVQLSYASPPTVQIIGGEGSGATATATVSGGKVTGITVTSGGSGYATTGLSASDIKLVMGTGAGQSAMTTAIAVCSYVYSIPFDYLAVANYTGVNNLNWPGYATSEWDRLTRADLVDAASGRFLYADDYGGTHGHIDNLRSWSNTGQFDSVQLVTYEGGPETTIFGSNDPGGGILRLLRRLHQCLHHPNFFYLMRAWYRRLHDVYGFVALTRFTLDNDSTGLPTPWWIFQAPMQGIGMGSPSDYNGNDLTKMVSQEFGAMVDLSLPVIIPTAGLPPSMFWAAGMRMGGRVGGF